MARIVGVLLVKNEDLFIRWVIGNILDFCDHILVLDNHSTDQTWEIVESLARENDRISLQKWDDAQDSQKALIPYYGTDTWVFGVDGDEVYDPSGLAAVRERLLSGEFDHVWRVTGHFLHCVSLDLDAMTADGYLSPPAMGGVKLYNFRMVSEWEVEAVERLHGRPVFSAPPEVHSLFLGDGSSWDDAALRCLHLCFIRRSSSETAASPAARWMRRLFLALPAVRLMRTAARWMKPLGSRIGPRSSARRNARRRIRNYVVGHRVTRDISGFGPLSGDGDPARENDRAANGG